MREISVGDIVEMQGIMDDQKINPPLHDFIVYDPFLGKAVNVSDMSDAFKKQIVDWAIKR